MKESGEVGQRNLEQRMLSQRHFIPLTWQWVVMQNALHHHHVRSASLFLLFNIGHSLPSYRFLSRSLSSNGRPLVFVTNDNADLHADVHADVHAEKFPRLAAHSKYILMSMTMTA